MSSQQGDLRRVYRIAWDGEPKMGGGFHVASVGTEFYSAADVLAAIDRSLSLRGKPGLRVETRLVSEWEVVP